MVVASRDCVFRLELTFSQGNLLDGVGLGCGGVWRRARCGPSVPAPVSPVRINPLRINKKGKVSTTQHQARQDDQPTVGRDAQTNTCGRYERRTVAESRATRK